MLEQILQFLDGRKAILLAVVGLVIGYLTATNVLDAQLGALILSVLNVLAGGAVVATNKVLGHRNFEGRRIL